jgi:hypothetical protein
MVESDLSLAEEVMQNLCQSRIVRPVTQRPLLQVLN